MTRELPAAIRAVPEKYEAFAAGLETSKKGGQSPIHDLAIKELRAEAQEIRQWLTEQTDGEDETEYWAAEQSWLDRP